MTTNAYGGYTVDQLREFIRHHYDAEHGGDNIDELTNDSSASVKIVRDLLDAIEPQQDGDLLRPIARWVYNAVRVNLDLLHGICSEFGCPQGEDVATWLRARLAGVPAPCMCSGAGPCEKRTDGSCRRDSAAVPAPADERAAFEANARKLGMRLDSNGGHYSNIRTRNRWLGWQARAASANETGAEGAKVDPAARMDWADGILRTLPPLDPTIAIEELLSQYGEDDKEEIFESIKAYADMRARQALSTQYAPRSPAMAAEAVPDWRELSRRLYVELFHCDQQMRSTRDEEGEPHWTQSAVVRDVLADAKAALDGAPAQAAEPFGWAQPKGGNYFTRNESSAKRIGGLVPVYTAPQPAQADARVGLTEPKMACRECACLRSGDTCWKCGSETFMPAAGWTEPELPPVARIRELAAQIGYAIGVHGSQERDLDLIAAPWTEDALKLNYREAMQHIADGLGARLVETELKPLGRRACTIQMNGWFKPIDLSVCPMLVQQPEPRAEVTDTARLDWLCERVVNVRHPLLYGSRDMFWASPTDDDSGHSPSDLRAQIDAARAGEKQ
ncbi:TPA: hypothetical protein RKT01_000518 [Burkholderia vietnamiensis]|nr:hypothetical protein [Burkholderia vietnamiensis]